MAKNSDGQHIAWLLVLAVVGASCVGAGSPGSSPAAAEPSAATVPAGERVPFPSDAGVTPLVRGAPGLSTLISGRVAVVDLWATWCEPCRETIPKIIRLHSAFADSDLVVAGVHVGDGADGAARFAAEAGMTYPQFSDRAFAFSDRIGSRAVPTLLVVDRQGRIAHRGTELDAEALQIVRALLQEPVD